MTTQPNEFEFEFEVKKIIYNQPKKKFMILRTIITSLPEEMDLPREIVVHGTIPVAYTKDLFVGKGIVAIHPIYGRYIQLTEPPTIVLPQIEKSLIDFIRRRVKGVGAKKARQIVEHLGIDAMTKIDHDYRCLLTCGFKEPEAKRIYENVIQHKRFEELIHFLQSLQIEADVADEIYQQFQGASVTKLRSNPYLISNIGNLSWLDADRVAKALNHPFNKRERYLMAILFYLQNALQQGNLCMRKKDLLEDFEMGTFLKRYGSYPEHPSVEREVLEPLIEELLLERSIVSATNNQGEVHLYLPSYYYIEEQIINGLDKVMNHFMQPFCNSSDIQDFIEEYEKKFYPLAPAQKDAIYMALTNRLSILTGGPGTGKTHTTNAIVQCIRSIKPSASILLLAPTGKAAKRMSEMTGLPAMTIHRGLGLKGFGRDDEITKLHQDFVIVDETSMMDAFLTSVLLNHIEPHTRLLLVGDYHQLPSVGPGLILRDFISSGKIPVTELTQIFRQAAQSQLVTNAHKMKNGITTTAFNGLTFDCSKGDSYFIERQHPSQIQEDVLETIRRFMAKGYQIEDVLILAPMHNGMLGTRELNRLIQREFNPPSKWIDVEKHDRTILRVGDRVIHTKNNKELGVYNGEIGTIQEIFYRRDQGKEEVAITVEFPDRDELVEYGEADIEQLELAYCISIHKSQGSESPIVIMPIHDTHDAMLDREMIYTGYTRTKEVHIFLGREELLNESLQRVKTDGRRSLIKEKIQKIL